MKSIRTKITLCLMVTVLATQLVVGASSITLNYNSTITTVDQMMSQTAVLAAERIEQELTAYKNVAVDTGCIPQLLDEEVPLDEKRSIIDERVSMHDFQRGNIVGADGISIFDGNDYSDREYVRQAMQGNVYVSEPLISKVTGELSIMVAAPLYEDGTKDSKIAGVVYFVPHETFLNDIVSSISVSNNSRAYMINRSGATIADTTLETITVQNIEAEAESDSSLKELAAIHADMREGKSGFGSYKMAKEKMFASYAPVNGTDGWSVAVVAPQSDYLSTTYFDIVINLVMMLLAILASIFVALKLANSIGRPMKACAERMRLLVEGDLESPVPEVVSMDETGVLTQSTAELVKGLSAIIHDIGYLLSEYFGFYAQSEAGAERYPPPDQRFRRRGVQCQRPGVLQRTESESGSCRTGQFRTAIGCADERDFRPGKGYRFRRAGCTQPDSPGRRSRIQLQSADAGFDEGNGENPFQFG